jgi:tungstate transport system ATP-binding protein
MDARVLLTLKDVDLRFGAVQALRGVSLTLHRGERLALVGANGSGKTSLLRVLHGLLACSSGAVSVGPAAAGKASPPGAAMVFQHPFLLHLSVRLNVLLGLWLRGVPRAAWRARCDEALQRVGLLELAGRPARALSGGQQQRLSLARAWALRPEVLYLDEPTASLDPSAKREVEMLIETIAAEGVTVVMSTHNLGQAKRLATRVLYLEGGRLLVDLPVERFFNDALSHEAAHFLRGELPWR